MASRQRQSASYKSRRSTNPSSFAILAESDETPPRRLIRESTSHLDDTQSIFSDYVDETQLVAESSTTTPRARRVSVIPPDAPRRTRDVIQLSDDDESVVECSVAPKAALLPTPTGSSERVTVLPKSPIPRRSGDSAVDTSAKFQSKRFKSAAISPSSSSSVSAAQTAPSATTVTYRREMNPFNPSRPLKDSTDQFSVKLWPRILNNANAECKAPYLMAEFATLPLRTASGFDQEWKSFFDVSLSLALELIDSEPCWLDTPSSSSVIDMSLLEATRLYLHLLPASVKDAASYEAAPDWTVYRLSFSRGCAIELAKSLISNFGLAFKTDFIQAPRAHLEIISKSPSATLFSGSMVHGSTASSVFSWIVFANPYPGRAGAWKLNRVTLARSRAMLEDSIISDLGGPVLALPSTLHLDAPEESFDNLVNYQLWMGYCTVKELEDLRTQPFMLQIDGKSTRNPSLTKSAISKLNSPGITYLFHALLHFLTIPFRGSSYVLNNGAEYNSRID